MIIREKITYLSEGPIGKMFLNFVRIPAIYLNKIPVFDLFICCPDRIRLWLCWSKFKTITDHFDFIFR
jgi:hypothetical protein